MTRSYPPSSRGSTGRWIAYRISFLALLCLLALKGISGALPDAELVLIANGRSDYVIVGNPEDPAVQDLQQSLKKMTGVELPIQPLKTEPLPEKAVVVGSCEIPGYSPPKLSPQGYHLKALGPRLIVHGGADQMDKEALRKGLVSPLGAQFGVYGLLDDRLGCRFLTKDFEHIPKKPTVSVSVKLDEIREPSIRDRISLAGGTGRASGDHPDWRRRNRMGYLLWGLATHNIFSEWFPPAKYFKEHPDWYPLDKDNQRKATGCDWLCWTNEAMLKELTRLMKQRMADGPVYKLVPVGQGDGPVIHCGCPSCTALRKQYGSDIAPMISGMNRVLKETAADFPHHHAVVFAYQGGTLDAPINGSQRLIPHPNLHINFVRMGDELKNVCSGKCNPTTIRDVFLKWSELTPNIRIWSWSINFRQTMIPVPNIKALAEDTRWFGPRVEGFAHQVLPEGDFIELREWLFARMEWNIGEDIEAREREFLRLYYGEAAAEPLWRHLDAAQQRAAKSGLIINAVFNEPRDTRIFLYPRNVLDQAMQDFQKAHAAAKASGNPDFVRHVERTHSSSLAMLGFVLPKEFQRVLVDGRPWLLPEGDARLAVPGQLLGEYLRTASPAESGAPFWNRLWAMDYIGGLVEPLIENDKIALAYCRGLDGIMASFVDKTTGTELLTVGPGGGGSQGGIHHTIRTPFGASDWQFATRREQNTQHVEGKGSAVVNGWIDTGALVHKYHLELKDGRRGFSVTTSLWTDPKGVWAFKPETYGTPTYSLSLTEPLYDPHVLFRFRVWNTESLRLACVGLEKPFTHSFSAADEKNGELRCQLPLATTGPGRRLVRICVINDERSIVPCLTTDVSQWQAIQGQFDPMRKELVLKLDAPPKVAAKPGEEVPMVAYEVDVLSPSEADDVLSSLRSRDDKK